MGCSSAGDADGREGGRTRRGRTMRARRDGESSGQKGGYGGEYTRVPEGVGPEHRSTGRGTQAGQTLA